MQEIYSTDEDYLIKFNNQEEGWNFNKTFTRVNLLFFYQDLDRLYRLYMWLCSLKLLYSFLKTNLLYLNP
jgi:hypothetical protein